MDTLLLAIIAGLVATAVLSAMMLMKERMGVMPQMDMIGMISGMMNASRATGWAVHFAVGAVVYGGAFWLWVRTFGTGAFWLRGAIVGAIGWLVAMLVMMPMAGNGAFGLKLGGMAPVASLAMHGVFGAVLGLVYGWMAG